MRLSFREKNPVTIAVITVVGTLVLTFGLFQLAALPIIDGSTYEARFAEAGGLKAGDKVMVAGTEAGEVKDVDLDDGDVLVTFTVKHVTLGDQTTAEIKTQTLLGERNLGLVSAGKGELGSGDEIPLARTKAPYSITQGIEDVTRKTGEIDMKRVGQALDVFSQTFQGTPNDLSPAFEGISRLSRTISSRDQALQQLLARAQDVTAVLRDRSAQLSVLITDGNSLLAELQTRKQVIDSLLEDTTRVANQIVGLNDDQKNRLQPALASLNHTIDILRRNQSNIVSAVDRVSGFITGIGEGLESGTSFSGYGELGGTGLFPTSDFIPKLATAMPKAPAPAPAALPLPGGGN